MNKQLFIVGLILILFIVVFWKQLKDAFTTTPRENFVSYPNDGGTTEAPIIGLMKLHKDFIVNTSTTHKTFMKKIETLVEEIMDSKVGTTPPVEITQTFKTKACSGTCTSQLFNGSTIDDIFKRLMQTFLVHFEPHYENVDKSVNFYKQNEDYQLKIVLYIGLKILQTGDGVNFQCAAAAAEGGGANEANYYDTNNNNDTEYDFEKLVCHFMDEHSTFVDNIKFYVKPKMLKLFERMFDTEYKIDSTDSTAKNKDILKAFLTELIKELYTLVYSTSENNVACVLHSASNCPNEPYSQINETNYADKDGSTTMVTSATQRVRSKQFRCQVDDDDATQNKICAGSVDVPNKHTTTNCEVMNGYAKEQCENTKYSGGNITLKDGDSTDDKKCRYDYFTEKCFNPTFDVANGEDNGFLSWKQNNGTTGQENTNNGFSDTEKTDVDDTKCHLISNKKYCDQQSNRCEWESERCVPTATASSFSDNDKVKFCHSLSMRKDAEGQTTTNKQFIKDFTQCNVTDNGSGYYYGIAKDVGDKVSNRKIDGSQGVEGDSDEANRPDPCAFIDANPVNDVTTQENLCMSLENDDSTPKCDFYKYPRYLPASSSEKHKYITKCVKKDTGTGYLDYSPEIMSNKDSCERNPKYIWSEQTKTCVKPDISPEECNIVKNSNICRLHSNCIWQATGTYDKAEGFERGFCKDMTSKFDKLYDVMNMIHDKHLSKYVQVTNLEEKLTKNMPSFKNQLASLK